MIKLWGRKTSSNVMKVIWLLEELGLAYERADVGGPFGGTATPEYRAINPLGLVPSLEEDAFTLFESNVILRYVCNAHAPDTAFYPAAPRPRATIEAWMDFQQTALNRPQSVVFQGLIRTAPGQRDDAAIAAAAREAAAIWAILDARLANQFYLAGDELTLADMTFGPHVHRWFTMAVNRPEAPHLHAWYERLLARPAFKACCAGPVV
ncbi:MAG: glutathione S-transferase [Caulobacteraceae bacterium]|nr:glutathione S-transferase [Caulobacteraceae bacterium]